jgi:[ribosomal protein S18]-alanine N-acetyltransferase
VQLRRAIPSDIPEILRVEQQSTSAVHWTAAQYEAMFSADASERNLFVATADSDEAKLSGFLIARCMPGEWEIENVVVAADRHRQGIARSLIQELMAVAGSAGVSSIILEVRKSNLPAVRLYENIGFKQEGRRKNYYQGPVEDAVLYRLTLHLCDKIP